MKKIFKVAKEVAVFAVCISCVGCQSDLVTYADKENIIEEQVISISVPEQLDFELDYSLILFEAKVKELSDGKITVERVILPSDFSSYYSDEADIYLLSNEQVVALDYRTTFAQLPFLFNNLDIMFTYLNDPNTALRKSSVTKDRLEGEILGVYQGDPYWILGRSRIYPDLGFLPEIAVQSVRGSLIYNLFGETNVIVGSVEESKESFAYRDAKYLEFGARHGVDEEMYESLKNITDLGHRCDSWWLIARDSVQWNTITRNIVNESVAFTLTYQKEARQTGNQLIYDEIVSNISSENADFDYNVFYDIAAAYYNDNYNQLEIPQDIWNEISQLVAIGK